MKQTRREFIKFTGKAGFILTGAGLFNVTASGQKGEKAPNRVMVDNANAKLEDGSVLSIPFWRIESGRDGPSLLLIAAQHGNEVQGAEVARRFKEACSAQLISGSVWLLPMANLQAIHIKRHSVNLGPEEPITKARLEGYNMNLVWPGNPDGNNTERLAHALTQSVLRHCSHSVDMHCWNHFNAAETLSVNDHNLQSPWVR